MLFVLSAPLWHRSRQSPSPVFYARKGVNLGVGYETMRRWYRDPSLRQDLEHAPLEAEVARLRRENAQLRQVNEILKAASAFFAKELDPRYPK